jgi:hypothetical protein
MRFWFAIFLSLFISGCAKADDSVRSMPFAFDANANVVRLSGRWVTDQTLDAPLLAKVNTAEIICTKRRMSCVEAVALLLTPDDNPRAPGELLFSVLGEYRIESWSDASVVAISEKKVADVTLRIDLANRRVSRRHQETKARGSESADPTFIVDWRLE